MKEISLELPKENLKVKIPEDWRAVLDYFSNLQKYTVMLIGGVDTGKSTLASLLLKISKGSSLILEADPGQPTYTLPSTFALVDDTASLLYKYFVGEVAPHRNPVEVLTGIQLLSQKRGKKNLIIDCSGYIGDDFALQLKVAKACLTGADHAVLIERSEGELEKYGYHFEKLGLKVLKCKKASCAKSFSQVERRERREQLFNKYFRNPTKLVFCVSGFEVINLAGSLSSAIGNLFSFDNSKGFSIELGIIERIDEENDFLRFEVLTRKEVKSFSKIKIGKVCLKGPQN